MIFAPDDDESLKLVGTLAKDCSGFDSSPPFEFSIDWKVGTGEIATENVTVLSCSTHPDSDGVDGRIANIRTALSHTAELSNYVLDVGLVGTSSLFISFDPTVSYVDLKQNNTVNPFGLRNNRQKKRSFQFATGLTEVSASFEIGGSAKVAAKVGPLEVEADIDADLSGSLLLSAGSKGVLLPVNDWLSKMKNITLPENAGFATARATLDGSFAASASALGFDVSATGGLSTPFVLDLMNRTAISTQKPNVYLDIDLPNIGDLRNLSIKDVIKLLQVCAKIQYVVSIIANPHMELL